VKIIDLRYKCHHTSGVDGNTFGAPLSWSRNMVGLLKDERRNVKNPLDGIVV
jgi:hypothetical protein